MNLKKALVGCILALSLVVGGISIPHSKKSFFAEGDIYPPINSHIVKKSISFTVASGDIYPPINGESFKRTSSKLASGDIYPPINTTHPSTSTVKPNGGADHYPPINA